MEVTLATPRGFCAGVDRAIEIVETALEKLGRPVYVKHEVVHNRYVISQLEAKGAIFIEDLESVPIGATLIYSAHGVSQQVRHQAKQRQFQVFDATCPLVTKVHIEVTRYAKKGYSIILIGHPGHPEVEGTLGQFPSDSTGDILLIETSKDVKKLSVIDPNKLAMVTQTTLSVDDTKDIIAALKQSFPQIQIPKKDDICYATQNRQSSVKTIASACDLILVIGSKNSSNSNRLREIAQTLGTTAYLIDSKDDIQGCWLTDNTKVGITAGASAPEELVQDVIKHIQSTGNVTLIEPEGIEENIFFSLPNNLLNYSASSR